MQFRFRCYRTPNIRQQRGDDAALIAADLLARRRAERVSTAGA